MFKKNRERKDKTTQVLKTETGKVFSPEGILKSVKTGDVTRPSTFLVYFIQSFKPIKYMTINLSKLISISWTSKTPMTGKNLMSNDQ